MLSGALLYGSLILLALLLGLMSRLWLKAFRNARRRPKIPLRDVLTLVGFGLTTLAVASVFALHLSWTSASVSLRLGYEGVRVLAILIFWPLVAGLLITPFGSGRYRWLGVGASVVIGVWYLFLSVAVGISGGGAPLARHPTKFLIPAGYVGWVEVKYGRKGQPPLPMERGTYICKIPANATLATSSPLEGGWARDEYVYYSMDGRERPLPQTNWGEGGMIWGEAIGGPTDGPVSEWFYVGTEDQFRKSKAPDTP